MKGVIRVAFEWKEYYERFADKLLEYKDRRPELLKKLHEAFRALASDGISDPFDGFLDIDPFSVFASFNSSAESKRSKTLGALGRVLEMKEDAPSDLTGIPVMPESNKFFCDPETCKALQTGSESSADHVRILWQVFETAIEYADHPSDELRQEFVKRYDQAEKQTWVKWNLSVGLSWVRPNKFISLHQENRKGLPLQGVPDGDSYLKLCERLCDYVRPHVDPYAYVDQHVARLKKVRNIILTGAPGTGKTYLAKQIAARMIFPDKPDCDLDTLSKAESAVFKEHCGFVQFHPSYDYTDFVEGLRAEDADGAVTFKLHDGIFKAFCKRALRKPTDENFDKHYADFLEYLTEANPQFETPKLKRPFRCVINSAGTINALPGDFPMPITKTRLMRYVVRGDVDLFKPYVIPLGNDFRKRYNIVPAPTDEQQRSLPAAAAPKASVPPVPPYVFIIDEINRGEISKIFGELFFSIDPSYRGKAGKVLTQYANIQSNDTVFDFNEGDGWFYVPKNVYIIGTMNDIDRSVESFDFAMRRRFTWVEITAAESAENMGLPEDAKKRMAALNDAISKIEGLDESYHIGAAYFLGEDGDIWKYRLEPLLKEYLRGMPGAKGKQLKTLEDAFFGNKQAEQN
ncbi:MAG: AAA family ATPase [Synergistaceae bacterium]|nr:AAA family ATPase [Synergistaceae bacterium]